MEKFDCCMEMARRGIPNLNRIGHATFAGPVKLRGIVSPVWMEHSAAPSLGLAYRVPLLAGESGTAQTIQLMRELVDSALVDAKFVRTAVDIVRSAPAYDEYAEVQALYNWVISHIRFTKDPVTKEKLIPPPELLKIRAGDCDDISMLLGAFAMAVGYNARLITVSANASSPDEFSHVYVEVEVPVGSGQWTPLDAARPDAQFGVEPPVYYRKRAWSLVDDSHQDLSGPRSFVHANVGRVAGLGSYGNVRGMGDIDWGDILETSLKQAPTIISAATGRTGSTTPYGSFTTPYTPGYGIPPAGYQTQPSLSAMGFLSSPWMWLALGVGAVVLLKGRR